MTIPHFDAAAVAAATPWPELIEALRTGFTSPHQAPDRHIHEMAVPDAPTATALLMPAWIEGEIYGVKLANIFPGNGAQGLPSVSSLYVVFDGRTGQLRATMDGSAITGRRTAATSALASTYLSHVESRRLLVLGAEVSIWARNLEQAERVAEKVGLDNDLSISAISNLDAVVSEADIISSATLSREPLIKGALLRRGTHLDLVGAYAPAMRETDGEAVARAEVFIDTPGGARAEAGDLIKAIAEGQFDWADVRADLGDLCAGRHPGRTDDNAITLFKSVGAAIEDLVAARLVLSAQ
jgi:alanine dehydrogenase